MNIHHRHKVATYSGTLFVDGLKKRYPRDNIFVRTLVFGARGTWSSSNNELIEQLGLLGGDCVALVSGILMGGVHTPSLWKEGLVAVMNDELTVVM